MQSFYAATTQGPRDHQDDAVYVDPRMLIVCDGVGGHRNGSAAANAACQALRSLEAPDLLHQVRATGGMTTATRVFLQGGWCWLQCGDSAAFLIRQGRVIRLTPGHNMFDTFAAMGQQAKTPTGIREQKRTLIAPLGSLEGVAPYIEMGAMGALHGDVVVGVTDGVLGAWEAPDGSISPAKVLAWIRQYGASPEALQVGVESAAAETKDNATAAILRL